MRLGKASKGLVASVLVGIMCFGTMICASSSSYTVNLPAFKGNVTCASGTKTAKGDSWTNYVSNVGADYDAANFWVNDGNGNQLTEQLTCYEGTDYDLFYNSSVAKGKSLTLRAENHDLTYVNVTMSGTVNFK